MVHVRLLKVISDCIAAFNNSSQLRLVDSNVKLATTERHDPRHVIDYLMCI